jgi:hypothetical protein
MSEEVSSCPKQPLGQGTMTKKRFLEIKTLLENEPDLSIDKVMETIKLVLNFDPNVTTYSSERGRQIVENRRKQAERMGVSTYFLNGKAHYERTRGIDSCASHICDSRGYEQYRGYCIRCFAHMHPEEPITRRQKTKESSVIHFLNEAFPDRPWVFDRKVDNGCSRYRPDIFLDLLTHSLIVEVDENQHDSYDCECENKRLMALFQDLGSRPLVLIRFNPDEYTKASGKRMKSCFVYRNVNGLPSVRSPEYWDSRLETLRARIQHYLQIVPDREVTMEHLYYDGFH